MSIEEKHYKEFFGLTDREMEYGKSHNSKEVVKFAEYHHNQRMPEVLKLFRPKTTIDRMWDILLAREEGVEISEARQKFFNNNLLGFKQLIQNQYDLWQKQEEFKIPEPTTGEV